MDESDFFFFNYRFSIIPFFLNPFELKTIVTDSLLSLISSRNFANIS